MKKTNLLMSTVASIALVSVASPAMAGDVYGPYPITLKGYSGDKTNSVSYSGQVGRQLLHNSLKKAIGEKVVNQESNERIVVSALQVIQDISAHGDAEAIELLLPYLENGPDRARSA